MGLARTKEYRLSGNSIRWTWKGLRDLPDMHTDERVLKNEIMAISFWKGCTVAETFCNGKNIYIYGWAFLFIFLSLPPRTSTVLSFLPLSLAHSQIVIAHHTRFSLWFILAWQAIIMLEQNSRTRLFFTTPILVDISHFTSLSRDIDFPTCWLACLLFPA